MRRRANDAATAYQRVVTPIGEMVLVAGPLGLVEVVTAADGGDLDRRMATDYPQVPEVSSETLQQAATQIEEYFGGVRLTFSVPMDWAGMTRFQVQTLQALQEVGFGRIVSYGELARRVGRPLAARAVGGVMAANPFPVIVPCHRVIGRGGAMTGYSGGQGVETKRWLLQFEQRVSSGGC